MRRTHPEIVITIALIELRCFETSLKVLGGEMLLSERGGDRKSEPAAAERRDVGWPAGESSTPYGSVQA